MRLRVALLAAIVILAALAFSLPQAVKADFNGTWLGKTELPEVGVVELTLILKKDEDSYAGTIVDSLQTVAPETAIQNVKVEGPDLTFTFPLVSGAIITCKLTIDGDKMTGQWEHPEGNMGALTFERKR
jgi:hypothetical protein